MRFSARLGCLKDALVYVCPLRIQAKTRELRERQARERDYAEILDLSRSPERTSEEEQHPYAGLHALNSSVDSGHSRPHSPRDDYPHLSPLHQHSDSLYTHVSKGRNERPPSADRWVGEGLEKLTSLGASVLVRPGPGSGFWDPVSAQMQPSVTPAGGGK